LNKHVYRKEKFVPLEVATELAEMTYNWSKFSKKHEWPLYAKENRSPYARKKWKHSDPKKHEVGGLEDDISIIVG